MSQTIPVTARHCTVAYDVAVATSGSACGDDLGPPTLLVPVAVRRSLSERCLRARLGGCEPLRWGGLWGLLARIGRVLVNVAVMLADGVEAIADIDVLRDQSGVFGPVASPTVWRARDAAAPGRLKRIAAARARMRRTC